MEITILFRCLRFKNSILNPSARGYRGVSGNGRDNTWKLVYCSGS